MSDSLHPFSSLIPILLGDESPSGVTEVLLDYALVQEYHPTPIQSLRGIEVFEDLKVISARNQHVQNLTGLAGLSHLIEADFTGNKLEEIAQAHFPASLIRLFLSLNALTSMDAFRGHPALQEIHLNGNPELDALPMGDFHISKS